ncbi:MAG: cytochrome P450 [Myxococcota bacterium]|nr:cytochrome P450 [Myxococcota bacterium]
MANAARESEERSNAGAANVVVAPAILAVIQSARTPIGVPRRADAPKSLPGVEGVWWAIHGLFGVLRRGVAYSVENGLERFGEVYRAPFIGNSVVAIWDADEIHKILKNEDHAWSTAMGWHALMFEGLDPRSGNIGALLTLDFDDHRVARKLVQPAFTLNAIKGYLAVAERRFDRAVPAWIERRRVSFKSEIRALLASVAGEIFTGIQDSAKIAALDRALSDFWHGMMAITRNPWLSTTFRRSRRGFETLRTSFLELVPERRKQGGDDLFSLMCRVEDRDGLTDEAVVRVFLTVMFGAFDTTSAAMTSMAYLLAKHPEWQERLRDEAQRIPPGGLDVSTMKSMRTLEWVWKETMRLMPVSSFVPRWALREVEVCGHALRAGTLVAPMAGAIGRHPKWWKEPLKFDPERFSPERAEDQQHPGISNPFGAGAHACVGMQLANLEMKAFWHKFLGACRFSLEKDYEARHTHTPMGTVSGKVSLRLEPIR